MKTFISMFIKAAELNILEWKTNSVRLLGYSTFHNYPQDPTAETSGAVRVHSCLLSEKATPN